MALPGPSPSSPLSLSQACAAAALKHSISRAAEASRASSLAKEGADEAERSLVPRVRALLGLDDDEPSSASPPSRPRLRVDIGSGVLAPASPLREKTVILPVGLGFYVESGASGGDGTNGREKAGAAASDEALGLAESRVADLRERAQRASSRASLAREDAEKDARLALGRKHF